MSNTKRESLGVCPAVGCGKPVYIDDDPVWTTYCNLTPSNPLFSEDMCEQQHEYEPDHEECADNPHNQAPLHGKCYNTGTW